MSNFLSTFTAYLSTVWVYFGTHWWLGLLFIVYHILLWHHKDTIDQTNTYYRNQSKTHRNILGVAQRTLKWAKIKKWF